MPRFRTQIYQVGDLDIRLRTPRDLNVFTESNANNDDVSDDAFLLGGIVWPSAEVLASLLVNFDIAGKRIL